MPGLAAAQAPAAELLDSTGLQHQSLRLRLDFAQEQVDGWAPRPARTQAAACSAQAGSAQVDRAALLSEAWHAIRRWDGWWAVEGVHASSLHDLRGMPGWVCTPLVPASGLRRPACARPGRPGGARGRRSVQVRPASADAGHAARRSRSAACHRQGPSPCFAEQVSRKLVSDTQPMFQQGASRSTTTKDGNADSVCRD